MAAENGSTTTGMRCFESESRCRFASCSVTDGTGANPEGACACGDSDCTDAKGLHCDVLDATSQCKQHPYCLNTDGSADNCDMCLRRAHAVNGTTGLRCFSPSRCRFTNCSVADGSASPEGACACGDSDYTDDTGFHCDASKSQCKPHSYCLNTDGSDNTVTCASGHH